MSLGATIYSLRKARGLSLADISRVTGINKAALSRFERDLEGLGAANFDRLCMVFGASPSVMYAVAKCVCSRPELLLDGDKLHKTVRSLGRLIENYLLASDDLKLKVDKLLE